MISVQHAIGGFLVSARTPVVATTTTGTRSGSDFANAGSDTAVEPFGAYTLTGTGSAVGSWTVVASTGQLSYSQAGQVLTYTPAATLTGSTLSFAYTVGAATDSVQVKVYPINERVVIDNTQRPVQWREVVRVIAAAVSYPGFYPSSYDADQTAVIRDTYTNKYPATY